MFIPSPWSNREPIVFDAPQHEVIEQGEAAAASSPRRVSQPTKKQPSVIQEKGESEFDFDASDNKSTSTGGFLHHFSSSRHSSVISWTSGWSSNTSGTPNDSPAMMASSSHGRRKTTVVVDLMREKRYLKRYLHDIKQEKELIKGLWKAEHELQELQGYSFCDKFEDALSLLEVFLSNMPLTIGALGLSWVTQGVVWFKFMEENNAACSPVRFNSRQCSFPEFPGCFQCVTTDPVYQVALAWHYFCHVVAGICCVLFLLKVVLAWRVVADELANPATSTPMGVVCITAVCVFAGRGVIGEVIVLGTSLFHLCLSFWFLHTAVNVYRLWPDPGWFPNTVGISYAAIKTWLYFPWTGKILMGLCMVFFFSTFFISLYRVAKNEKIALPVCFIQLSAPSITLYAVTILAQPSHHREIDLENDSELMQHFEDIHRTLYLPFQHCMLALSLAGMVSILHATYVRWDKFKEKEFSPAHMALVFPVLSHTNAIQAYRSGVDSFSEIPQHSPFKIALFTYWFILLIVGTNMCLVFTYHFIKRLPRWTRITERDEPELAGSPPPSDISVSVMESMYESDAHEPVDESLVSPAVLQANEAGALVRVRRGTEDYERFGPYRRTRRVSSLGFDPILGELEFEVERAQLLEWAARNAPRRRRRTLSIPSTFRMQEEIGGLFAPIDEGNDEPTTYGSIGGTAGEGNGHQRSHTSLV